MTLAVGRLFPCLLSVARRHEVFCPSRHLLSSQTSCLDDDQEPETPKEPPMITYRAQKLTNRATKVNQQIPPKLTNRATNDNQRNERTLRSLRPEELLQTTLTLIAPFLVYDFI